MDRKDRQSHLLKWIVGALILVFLFACFMILKNLDQGYGNVSVTDTDSDVVSYQGKDYQYKKNLETFLVLGLDRNEDSASSASHEGGGVQTDFLMLFVFDNDAKQCTAIQINRDTMTKVNKLSVGGTAVVDSFTAQIALAYNYVNDDNDKIRCRNTKDSVEYLLNDIHVDHYLALTMDAVPVCCDLVDGVEVTVLDDFTGIDDALIKDQKVTLRGEQALTYVRTRNGLEDNTNLARMERQRQFMDAFYDKLISCMNSDEEFLVNLAEAVDEYIVYDSTNDKLVQLAEKKESYEFLGIRELEGESKAGEEFMEFYPDEDAKTALVMEVFYTSKN